MTDELLGALERAQKLEIDGAEYYLNLAARCRSQAAAEMFRSFAADEHRHLRIVRDMAEQMSVDVAGMPTPREEIRTIFGEAAERADDVAQASADEKEAVAVAMGMEKASFDLYTESAREAEDDETRRLLERLALEENQHYEMLENTLEYLNANDQWFLWTEGGLLTGDQSSLGG
jgi:rubrerythrin